ncbi:hypothetical protein [Haladaptatus cibarius]|uniref:hypothetical protein n=1 Tax=Haladaptatus cibarius TaxID=453847 RepID=UPI00067867DB|nr:hypothetical protein [Haladaptatus cibarius]
MPRNPLYRIEQGPRWLVEFYLTPPWWVNPSLKVLGLVVAGVVAYVLYRRGYEIPPTQQRTMLQVAATVVGVMTGVLVMTNYAGQPYHVDVGVGLLVGYGLVTLLANVHLPLPFEGDQDRLTLGWGILAACSIFLPWLARMNGEGTLPSTSRWYLVVLSVVMIWYNQYFVPEVLDAESEK